MTTYDEFLGSKVAVDLPSGFEHSGGLPGSLFAFQSDIVRWALRRGRAAVFADTGLGKTRMQLAWADAVARHTGGQVLILAPLAVAHQTVREARSIGVDAVYAEEQCSGGVLVSNYEKLHRFDPGAFAGVVLDESSIIKSYDGKLREQIIGAFGQTAFRLACTATPAPNDHMELGNHAEFLGVLSRVEMLSTFFVHDGGETQKWRLKGHARGEFWRWVCSWAVAVRHPADLGYDATGYDIPPLDVREHVVEVSTVRASDGMLFALEARTLEEQRRERKATIGSRVRVAADLVNSDPGPWIVWCDLNDESKALTAAIDGAVELTGSDSPDVKVETMMRFTDGEIRVLVSKPQICGFGMNWQHCARMAFVGVSHSFERYYQAVRRCWRFGQKKRVQVHVITASTEGRVVESIKRKQADAQEMMGEMVANMTDLNKTDLKGGGAVRPEYAPETREGDGWTLHLGDCVDVARSMPDASAHYAIFSPPFASLYTYSASERDMGNCRTHSEFFDHFSFLVTELRRVLMPGRLVSFHCMNLPTSKARDGVIGLTDFRGELIRMFAAAGFVYHSEVVIWKDPVTAMQRTKAIGLLHKQLKKDSALSRQGIPDYLVTMRNPGDNPEPIAHTNETFPVQVWQRFASPVWMDINPSDTLQYRSAREHDDERHICPLQLSVIRRGIELWSNPGDVVLSPFAGIGSEGHVALQEGRRFVGAELKRSYFEQACRNLAVAKSGAQPSLFDAIG
jgi:hypothetical protein